jgi:hypothetical protein
MSYSLEMKALYRCRCPNNGLFIVALVLLITFLAVELFLRMYNLYYHEPFVDVPSHFFAGLAIGSGAAWIWSLNEVRHKKTATILATFAVSVIWEILETLQELVIENPPYLHDIFVWDGVLDITVTVLGGAFSLLFIQIIRKTTNMMV